MSEGVGGSVGADLAAIEARPTWEPYELDRDAAEDEIEHLQAEVSRLGQQLCEARAERDASFERCEFQRTEMQRQANLLADRKRDAAERDAALALVGQLQAENRDMFAEIKAQQEQSREVAERHVAEVGQLQGQLDDLETYCNEADNEDQMLRPLDVLVVVGLRKAEWS